jgi:hypothetical protein
MLVGHKTQPDDPYAMLCLQRTVWEKGRGINKSVAVSMQKPKTKQIFGS